jgi:hypothetical protein
VLLFGNVADRFKVFVPTSLNVPLTGKMLPTRANVLLGRTLVELFPPGAGTTLPTKVFVKAEADLTKKPVPTGIDGFGLKPLDVFV